MADHINAPLAGSEGGAMSAAIREALADVMRANPDKVELAKAKPSLSGWFVGMVMKHVNGFADPIEVRRLVREQFPEAPAFEAIPSEGTVKVRALERSNGEGGWTLPVPLLEAIQREAVEIEGWASTTPLEVIEAVSLVAERRVLACLAPTLSGEAEAVPVAWRYRFAPDQAWSYRARPARRLMNKEEQEPLYAHPAEQPGEVERAAEALYLANTLIVHLKSDLAETRECLEKEAPKWRPIEERDQIVETIQTFGEVTLRNSHPVWVRDADGRVYEAVWTIDGKGRGYWWDTEGESPVDPVAILPHPLTERAALTGDAQEAGE